MIQIKVDSNNRVETYNYENEKKDGWVEIDSIPKPEQKEGYTPIPYYRDGQIVYEYEAIPEVPEEEEQPMPEIPYEEQVVAKIRERYSIDDELAILRQRDTKPEEFEAYNAYAEQCKTQIKNILASRDN